MVFCRQHHIVHSSLFRQSYPIPGTIWFWVELIGIRHILFVSKSFSLLYKTSSAYQ